MILHENHLPADNSHEISCLICYFLKRGKTFNCRQLQIIGGALRVNVYFPELDHENLETCKSILNSKPLSLFMTYSGLRLEEVLGKSLPYFKRVRNLMYRLYTCKEIQN